MRTLLLAAAIALAGPPSPAQAERAVVWAAGDVATPGVRADRVAALVRRGEPDLFLYLGDVYETGTAEDFRRWYHPRFGGLARITEPTIGNHEWDNRFEGYYRYWYGRKGHRLPPWSKTEIAGWEILSLNSQAPHGIRSPQVRWLDTALEGPGDCRIAFWHRPRYSEGRTAARPTSTRSGTRSRPAPASCSAATTTTSSATPHSAGSCSMRWAPVAGPATSCTAAVRRWSGPPTRSTALFASS